MSEISENQMENVKKLSRFLAHFRENELGGGTYRAKNTLPNRPKLQE